MTIASSKGQMGFEMAWVVIALVVIGIGLIVVMPAFQEVNDDIQADSSIGAEAKQSSTESVGNSPTYFDNVFFFMFIMLWIFLVIAAFFATTNPVFTVITIILVIFGLVITMFLANAAQEVMEDSQISSFADEFPKTSWILEHLLMNMVIVSFSVMLVLYGRSRA